ncbi:MAG: beta-galactosidase [Kiritimatiellae bacterium]|nr:beta-galactosidase [Kiritimatiellia bacterium]
MKNSFAIFSAVILGAAVASAAVPTLPGAQNVAPAHTFSISYDQDAFLLDGKPFTIRCGEVHYARIPHQYWRHRMKMLRAMGCNAVGCYMFWNYHEREPGRFRWEGNADARRFCKIAQEEGLWVLLRPGPYACAEWEGGGAPWFLLKDDGISMRSSDPKWLEPAKKWIAEVGRELGDMQITKGGPILMVQVENEYGLHGSDTAYIRALREATLAAGFDVPLYCCNPPRVIQNGYVAELFQAANFGAGPEQKFEIIRQYQPKGPLMCAEYYPAWFDTWGQAHHYAKSDREFFGPIEWMLERNVSFSLYMAHGGTSFGGWTGCRNPFSPNVTSYDYEAPINEQGRANPSFAKYRDKAAKHLNEGETIPPAPASIPVKSYGKVQLRQVAGVEALVTREISLENPVYMEKLDQGFGLVSYETEIPAGASGTLNIGELHDFGYVFLDGVRLGTLDRRHRGIKVQIPQDCAGKPRKLQILVEAMGRINSSSGMEDRKGLNGKVRLGKTPLTGWKARLIPLDPDFQLFDLATATFHQNANAPQKGDSPAIYTGILALDDETPADTWLDMSAWSKGMVWINGHNLGRFWAIGPQQTLFVPGCWLRKGRNDITVIDFFGPRGESSVMFTEKPVLDVLHPELDFNSNARQNTKFIGGKEVAAGSFSEDDAAKVVMFKEAVKGVYFTFEATSTYDKKSLASISEFDFLDKDGNPLASSSFIVSGVDSEEEIREDGVAENAMDGQVETIWLTSSRTLPHWIEFAAPEKTQIHGFRYTPKQNKSVGRIKDWKFYVR